MSDEKTKKPGEENLKDLTPEDVDAVSGGVLVFKDDPNDPSDNPTGPGLPGSGADLPKP